MWLTAFLACTPGGGKVVLPGEDSTPTVTDSDPPVVDSAQDSGDPGVPPESVGGATVSDEEVPSLSDDMLALCQMALRCDRAIGDDKTGCDFSVETQSGYLLYEGRAGVELRGRSSSGFPKHQYALELWDDADAAVQADLMGLGMAADWVLNGAWVDRALFRNKLTYDLFQAMGGADRYAPESRYCELTLNGDYEGIYLLVEKIEAEGARIALPDEDLADGGAFVLKLDESGLVSNSLGYGAWNLVSPNESQVTAEASAAIVSSINAWRDAAWSADPADPSTGIFATIDLDSAVDIVLIEEFAKNNDGWYLSLHLWRSGTSLIRFAPWDIDLGYGQPSYNNNESPEEWILYRPDMIDTMSRVPAFRLALAARWVELRADLLSEEAIEARIDDYVATMGEEALARNFERWPIEEVDFGGYLYEVSSYEEELERVRAWIPERLAWMDANIAAY